MMNCRIVVLLALSLFLAGCASTEQIAQRNNDRCVNRGYQPNTADFNKCLALVDNERQQRVDARRQEWMEKSANPLRRD